MAVKQFGVRIGFGNRFCSYSRLLLVGAIVALSACTARIESEDEQPSPDGLLADGGTRADESDLAADDSADEAEEEALEVAALEQQLRNRPAINADSVWQPLTVAKLADPTAFGAVGNGSNDDTSAIKAAVDSLPTSGGIVFFPTGKSFKKTNILKITKGHVKLWAQNRDSEIFSSIAGQRRRQAILCQNTTGCGVFGLKLRSDANARFDALEDNQVSMDHTTLGEVVGNEINSSAAVGVFFLTTTETYVEGNYIHHTWADHIHHTDGSTVSFVWGNYINNAAPSKGDDGIACVTYGPTSPRCADMEWWKNTILHTDWGRGFSVIGGNNINIHDNWAIGVAGAGIIVASEASYNSAASQGITIARNYVVNSGHAIGHPGLLISGMSSAAGPLRDIALTSNFSVNIPAGAYRVEGQYQNVTNNAMSTTMTGLPAMPTTANIAYANTGVMRTRDTSFVTNAAQRVGLYRIHVRKGGTGFQQRFEYVVKGTQAAVDAFATDRTNAKDYVSEKRVVDGVEYAVVLTAAPVAIPGALQGVSFREMRDQDRSGKLSWLWTRVDGTSY